MNEPVAVIGASCRMPGAATLDEFWSMLDEGPAAGVAGLLR